MYSVYKFYQVQADHAEPAIIDNNELSERRIEELAAQGTSDFTPLEGFGVDPFAAGMGMGEEEDGYEEDFSGFMEGLPAEQLSADENAGVIGGAMEELAQAEFIPDDGMGFMPEEEEDPAATLMEEQETPGVNPELDMEAVRAELDEQIAQARAEAEQILANAQNDAQNQLNEANEQAQTITAMAHEEAQRVHAEAVEQGRAEGYEAGLAAGQAEIERKSAELDAERAKVEHDFKLLVDNIEPEMVDVLTQIYEHIFDVDLRENKGIILHLLQTTLSRMEGSSNIIIHVSSDDYDMVVDEKPRLQEAITNPGSTMEIIEDPVLTGNECIIETDGGVFDCSLGVELAELTRKLRILSFERKK